MNGKSETMYGKPLARRIQIFCFCFYVTYFCSLVFNGTRARCRVRRKRKEKGTFKQTAEVCSCAVSKTVCLSKKRVYVSDALYSNNMFIMAKIVNYNSTTMALISFGFPPRLGDCAEIWLEGASLWGFRMHPWARFCVFSAYLKLLKKRSFESKRRCRCHCMAFSLLLSSTHFHCPSTSCLWHPQCEY